MPCGLCGKGLHQRLAGLAQVWTIAASGAKRQVTPTGRDRDGYDRPNTEELPVMECTFPDGRTFCLRAHDCIARLHCLLHPESTSIVDCHWVRGQPGLGCR